MSRFSPKSISLDNIRRFLSPPVFPEDEEKTRIARWLHIILLTGTAVAISYSLLSPFIDPKPVQAIAINAVMLVIYVTLLILTRRGKVALVSLMFSSVIWLIVTVAVIAYGGILSPGFLTYFVVIGIAGLFMGERATIGFAGLTILVTLALLYAEQSHLLPSPLLPITPAITAWLATFSLVMTALTTYLALHSFKGALQRARHELVEREKTEQKLRESEERFRLISSIMSDYTFSSRFNAQGELENTLLTGAFEAITGYTPEEFEAIGGWRAILHPDDLAQDEQDMAALRENQRVVTEVRIIKKGGEVRWVRNHAHPVWDAKENRLVGINGGVHDITGRKQAEAALRESERRYRVISELISDYAFAYDVRPDGSFTPNWITEDSFMRVTGYSWRDVEAPWSLYHPEDRLIAQQHFLETVRGQPTAGEYRIITKSGQQRWLYLRRQPVWSETEQRVIRLYGVAQDITARKQVEEALRESEERYRLVSQLASDYAYSYRVDADNNYILEWITEESFFRQTGVRRSEFGNTINLYHPDDLPLMQQDMQDLLSGRPHEREYRIITRTGEVRWIHMRRTPVWDEREQRVIRFYGAARDITERKRAEGALRHSEAMLRALLDATTDVAFLMAADGTLLTLNKTMAEAQGMTAEAMVGMNGFDLLKPDMRAERRRRFEEVLQSRQPLRWEDLGTTGWWDNSIYPVLSPAGTVEAFAVYSRNISEQKRLAAELQRYTERLEQMVEERTSQLRRAKEQIEVILHHTSDAIALAQPNGDIETKNPAFAALFGDRVSEYIEHVLWTVTSDEQCAAVGSALMNAFLEIEQQRVEAQIISERGHHTDIEMALIPVPLADDDSRAGILVSAHDITHFKEIERFKARFVADALHDLATPIAGLKTRLYLLRRAPERLEEHARALENQVEHLHNLLADLRTLAQLDRRQLSLNLAAGNLNQIVLRVFDTYEPVALSRHQSLTLKIDQTLPAVLLDSQKIERVLVNLVANAINYTPNGKTIRIQTSLEGSHIAFTVTDEGIGIGPADLPHIFERFYRTNQARSTQSSGTGLGLAIVREIVELHKGTVSVSSEPGEGSTFTVRLPIK